MCWGLLCGRRRNTAEGNGEIGLGEVLEVGEKCGQDEVGRQNLRGKREMLRKWVTQKDHLDTMRRILKEEGGETIEDQYEQKGT